MAAHVETIKNSHNLNRGNRRWLTSAIYTLAEQHKKDR